MVVARRTAQGGGGGGIKQGPSAAAAGRFLWRQRRRWRWVVRSTLVDRGFLFSPPVQACGGLFSARPQHKEQSYIPLRKGASATATWRTPGLSPPHAPSGLLLCACYISHLCDTPCQEVSQERREKTRHQVWFFLRPWLVRGNSPCATGSTPQMHK